MSSKKNVLSVNKMRAAHALALFLAVITVVYNLGEGVLATWFGMKHQSLSLFGFGIDSFVETVSACGIVSLVLRLQREQAESDRFEKLALSITGWSLYVLGAGLVISAGLSVAYKHQPDETVIGAAIAIISILVMWWLIDQKKKVGNKLESRAILADAKCGEVCMYMSGVLLVSSVLAHFGIRYVDAVGALGIAWFAFTEARHALAHAKGNCQHEH
jgi:divalent metal cation (Fe/Co/Zn/Cd) transporter